MKIAQVSITYQPLLGGQEVYIDQLNHVIEKSGWSWHVFQRDNGYRDPNVTLVKTLKFLKPVVGFNVALLTQFFQLSKYDRLIIHYPDHFPTVAWHKGAIVLTHGVNWELDHEEKKQRRIKLAQYALKKAPSFVANDTHFYRTMGIEVKPATHFFEEVEKNKWFIPNCVDTAQFKRTVPHPLLAGKKVITVPRNITPARGIDIAIEAFALIAEKYPEVYMAVVGGALPNQESQDYKRKIMSRIDELKLGKRVTFLGSVPHEQMAQIYSGSVATIIPTRANEGTALSALESMSCETPTLVTSVAGLKDLPAVQCAPEAKSVSEGLVELLLGKEKIGAKQADIVRNNFNLDLWAQAWKKVIISTNGSR